MSWRSEARPRFFGFRYGHRLFWCHGCGKKMKEQTGLLTSVEGRLIQWACLGCAMSAWRPAQT